MKGSLLLNTLLTVISFLIGGTQQAYERERTYFSEPLDDRI